MKCAILNEWYTNRDKDTYLVYRLKNEEGKIFTIEVGGTESDFYVPKESQVPDDWRIKRIGEGPDGLFGEKTKKIVTFYPTHVRDLKDLFTKGEEKCQIPFWEQTWQADIVRVQKSRIEYYIYGGIDVPSGLPTCHIDDVTPCDVSHIPITTHKFDIEAFSDKDWFPDAKNPKHTINSLSIVGEKGKCVFFLRKGKDPVPQGGAELRIFDNEKELIIDFYEWLIEKQPDMLECWNADFDVKYLNTRIKEIYPELKEKYASLITHRNEGSQILDIQVFDSYQVYKVVSDAPSNKLKHVVIYEGLVEETVADEYETNWWGIDNNKLVLYNLMDSEYLALLDKKYEQFDYVLGIKNMAGLAYIGDVMSNKRIIDTLLMRMVDHSVVLPTETKHQKGGFKGALVLDATPGYYTTGMAVMDFSRCYPIIIVKFNLSPEVPKGSKEWGILPKLCNHLMLERDKYEVFVDKALKEHGPESEEFKIAKKNRDRVKFLLNAVYGVVGSPHFRIFREEISGEITRIGRAALSKARDFAEEEGHKVLYGDTDSIFVEVSSPEEAERLAVILTEKINNWLDSDEVNKFVA